MKLATYPRNLFQPAQTFVDRSGILPTDIFEFIRSLFNRTGSESGIIPSVGTGLIATGQDFGGALALTDDWNEVVTVPAGSGVSIPELKPGQTIIVFNAGKNTLKVYPWQSAAIDALAVGVPYQINLARMQFFYVFTPTQIRSAQTTTFG